MHEPMQVDVCVATFRRPQMLGEALRALAAQRDDPGAPSFRVVVVDNDAGATATGAVEAVRAATGLDILLVHEPRQGISHARNAALDAATADFVAFIDDDEVASAGWLVALCATQARERSSVVLGPVVPVFDAGVPEWKREHPVFTRPRHPTGTKLRLGATNNVLIDRRLIAEQNLRFDPAFALTGGEDTAFFELLRSFGAEIVWCDEAVVSERVPAERTRMRWILRRAFRGGQGYARVMYRARRGWRFIPWMGRQLLKLFGGAGLALLLCLPARARALRALTSAAGGLGQLSVLAGRHALFDEYRASRVTGT